MLKLYLHRNEIEKLNGVSDKAAQKIMREIKQEYNLPNTRYISITAYCEYFKVFREDVYKALANKDVG